MTDELREELAQAAAATSQAYAVGTRNLSATSSLADTMGTYSLLNNVQYLMYLISSENRTFYVLFFNIFFV